VNRFPDFIGVFAIQYARENAVRYGGEKPRKQRLIFEQPPLILIGVLAVKTIGN
jgi:hypothetical protein